MVSSRTKIDERNDIFPKDIPLIISFIKTNFMGMITLFPNHKKKKYLKFNCPQGQFFTSKTNACHWKS